MFVTTFLDDLAQSIDDRGARQLDHGEMEKALLKYCQESIGLIDENQLKSIKGCQDDEANIINLLKLKFSQAETTIDPDQTAKIIELWQIKTEYKKDVVQNMPEVDEFLKNAYNEAKEVVDRAVRNNPREAKQSIADYERNLIEAIETDLTIEPSHIKRNAYALAAGEPMRQAIHQAKRDVKEECLIEVNVMLRKACQKIKPDVGEKRKDYIMRVSQKVRKDCKIIDQKKGMSGYMLRAADTILENFLTDELADIAYETVSIEIEDREFFRKKFTKNEINAFRADFRRVIGHLPRRERADVVKVREVANEIFNNILEKRYENAKLSSSRVNKLENLLYSSIIKGFLDGIDDSSKTYYAEKKINISNNPNSPVEEVGLQFIISRAYKSFVVEKLERYIAGKKMPEPDGRKIISDFKEYLVEDKAFRKMFDSIAKDGGEKAGKFLDNLVIFFEIFPAVEKTIVYEDKKPTPVPPQQRPMIDIDSVINYLVENPPEEIEELGKELREETEELVVPQFLIDHGAAFEREFFKSLNIVEKQYYREGVKELGVDSLQEFVTDAYAYFIDKYSEKPIKEDDFDFEAFDKEFKEYLSKNDTFTSMLADLGKSDDHKELASKIRNYFLPKPPSEQALI